MDSKKLVINTLVFIDDLKSGIPQSTIIDKIQKLGIKNIEIRREFIKDFNKEIIDIKEKSNKYKVNLFYSVPEWIFKENKLRYEEIEGYFIEANKMNCKNVKLNIGEVDELLIEDVNKIEKLCTRYNIKATIENDQTFENGRAEKIYKFLKRNRELGGSISFTFDVGNWIFQNEDPSINAEILNEFVTYIHLKNVDENKGNTLIGKGILNLKNILDKLPKDVPMALEYPCKSMDEIESEIAEVLKL